VGGEYTTQREVKKVLVVAITSNRGLCGAFNSNVIKASKAVLCLCRKTSRCFAIGKKGNDVLVKTSVVIDNQSAVYDDLTFDNVAVIADVNGEIHI
jgi:F-type H+-transporting ATPase subunit gamma